MFNTKIEVDKHVENCLRKINSELERNLRSLAFSKLYYKVGGFEQALRYIKIYLNAKPSSAEAQNLYGKTLERLGKYSQALEAYRLSLDLDPKQNSLVLKICELMAQEQSNFDHASARYYCEKAQNLDPNNPIISQLKERLVAASSKDPNDVTNLLLKELEGQPLDVNLRIRLLRHLVQNNRAREAYTHAYDVEQKNIDVFLNNLQWYETVADVIGIYRSSNSAITWEFWMMYVSVWDKLVSLSLNERAKPVDCISLCLTFDQGLQLAVDKLSSCPQNHMAMIQEFWRHYTGQLCWHLVTLLYKQARKELIKYREALQFSIPLLFAAYNFKPVDLNALWIEHTMPNVKQLMRRWNREGAYRCTQAGNMLKHLAKDRKTLVERASQGMTGMWREKTFKFLFIRREQQNKIKTSYFVLTKHLLDIQIRMADAQDLANYTLVAQLVHPDSLHHHIWLGLHMQLIDFNCTVFPGLQYTVKSLSNCAAETLNVLDVQSFIYAAIICCRITVDDQKQSIYYNTDKPTILPIACTELLGTANQEKWLRCAYQLFTNQRSSEFSDSRMAITNGIETVRCVGNHGMDARLLVQLARLFSARATKANKQSEIEANDIRAEIFWKAAMHLLEKMERSEMISYSNNRLFEYKGKEYTHEEIQKAINDGKLFLGVQAMKKKDFEKAINLFNNVKDPYASFHQAQIYKIMADKETNVKQEDVTSEMRSQNIILLTKSRDCLYLTLDRLGMPGVDPKHQLNGILGTEIEKIERLLSRIDPDSNRNDCECISDDNVSSIESENCNYTRLDSSQVQSTPFRLETSRRETRPSPERLDAQIRQLAASKDLVLNRVLEQNKFMIESQKTLTEELKSFRETVGDLAATINDLKSLKVVVDDVKEIKKTVEELESLRTVQDMVHELKKEVAELKKDQQASASKSKPQQLSEEDLYVLDDEYTADFTNAHSVSSLSTSLYPNVTGRINSVQNPLGYPTSPIYGYPMYPYGAVGLTPPTAPVGMQHTVDPQLAADYRTMNLLQGYSQFPHPTLQQPQAALPQPSFMQQQYQPTSFATQQAANLVMPPITSTLNFGGISQQTVVNSLPAISLPSATTNSRAPPVNVVITSSDPLPKTTPAQQPVLSVTIPPQHIKGNKVHNYQISLPANLNSTSTPSVLSQAPLIVSTQSMLSNVSAPVYSSLSDQSPTKSSALGLQIERSLNNSFNKSGNNASDFDTSKDEEHDPIPDFKAIIPLPEEVPVHTGEENEIVLFKERAKLFRYVNKEWKDRGVGELKILQDKDTKKVRLLMRRDQVHKICANHYITSDIELNPKDKHPRAYVWGCTDFSEGEVVAETLCAQFKTVEIAKKFAGEFERCKRLGSGSTSSNVSSSIMTSTSTPLKNTVSTLPSSPLISSTTTPSVPSSLGGFKFMSTPSFIPKAEEKLQVTPVASLPEPPKSGTSPFATFAFGTTPSTVTTPVKPFASFSNLLASSKTPTSPNSSALNNSSVVKIPEKDDAPDEFVPTAEFKPVVPLPELVEIKTGEESAEVLFEAKAKLLRHDQSTKEWKERGIGQMKILKEANIVRLVMRREQVHKVCCNHQLLKSMVFTSMAPNAVSWGAQDFSEGNFVSEIFTIKFKTEEILKSFTTAVKKAQDQMNSDNSIVNENSKNSPHKKLDNKITSGFGDIFKPKPGDWECRNCLIMNEPKVSRCIACETPKNEAVAKAVTENKFSFGVGKGQIPGGFLFGTSNIISTTTPTTAPGGFGDLFKPKVGSWECKECYTRNDVEATKCISCEVSKIGNAPKANESTLKGVDLSTGGLTFSFGTQPNKASTPSIVPTPIIKSTAISDGFGDQFKPKAGSWECKSCYTRNDSGDHCLSCEAPKDEAVAPKTTSNQLKGVDLSTGGVKFSFGMPPKTDTPSTPPTIFGVKAQTPLNKDTGFSFTLNPEKKEAKEAEEETVFGSPHKVGFEFTPRSPRRQSSGQHHEDEADNSYYEEEEANVYFKPVIPLPDKVAVVTGEENEDVLYCHRAKLYRHTNGEWKERGIGDLKILLQTEQSKLRVLMRREQVHKICLNHVLTRDINYIKKDDKSWLFHAPDYSEGEIEHSSFCLRFKTCELADDFLKAVNDALKRIVDGSGDPCIAESDSDVEFIGETVVPKEDIDTALKLKLPPKFLAYKQLPDCTCAQCLKDEAYYNNTLPSRTPVTSLFKAPSSISVFSETTGNLSPSVFNQKPISNDSVSMPSDPQKDTLKSLLTTKSIFGNITTPESPKPVGAVTTTSNIFGSGSKPIFGGFSAPSNTTQAGSIFGLGAKVTSFSGGNLFGSPAPPSSTTSIFNSGGTIFGGGTKTSGFDLNMQSKTEKQQDQPKPFSFADYAKGSSTGGAFGSAGDKVLGQNAPDVSFSSLAATAESMPFGKPKESNESMLANLGAGAPVFGITKNTNADDDDGEVAVENEHDPHYEPIVPLPDEVEVKTGEEDEKVLFSERGKLYRFNNKEWKERGVGNIKVLFHPINKTYRLVLRREQVHKIVLNQRITTDMELIAFTLSSNAWMWAGMNYSEDGHNLEKLAVRFKKEELSKNFYDAVQEAISSIKLTAMIPSASTTLSTHEQESEEEDDDEYEEEDEDEDERFVMYSAECKLYEQVNGKWVGVVVPGLAEIVFDRSIEGSRIIISNDAGIAVSNTLIAVNTEMERKPDDDGCELHWRAIEYADDMFDWRQLQLKFDTVEEASAFHLSYQEGKGFAEQSKITDSMEEI